MTDYVLVSEEIESAEGEALLDLSFSTSQTLSSLDTLSPSLKSEVEFQIEQSQVLQAKHCENHAPTIFYVDGAGRARLVEGCCNSWTCPRCGQIRARHEFTRIVVGADSLANEHRLYFWTLTCRGKEMSLRDAEDNYLLWTNRMLTAARAKAKRVTKSEPKESYWCYVQVTERQQRKHPHSHILITFCPTDAKMFRKGERQPNERVAKHETMWSDWFRQQAVKSGLGQECEISPVRSAASAASYIAKYLFKDVMSQRWPKGWRRVRYSQNYPKLPEYHNPTAVPLIKHTDWLTLERRAALIFCDSEYTYERALAHGVYNVFFDRC